MPSDNISQFYLVDFENVPQVDLGPAVKQPAVHVTLLLGKLQKKLEVEMVEHIQALGNRIELVKVGASGHNALDIVLACHLGRKMEKYPDARFVIVSKDKDFAPLIAHLKGQGFNVSCEASLNPEPAKRSKTKTAPPFPTKTAPAAAPKAAPADKKLEKLIEMFRAHPEHCPSKLEKLRHVIFTHFGKKASEAEQETIVRELAKRGIIKVEDGKVTCLLTQPK